MNKEILIFTGAPGTGKTTTIAKYVLMEKQRGSKSIAVVSTDTYTIGGRSIMEAYCNLGGVLFCKMELQELPAFSRNADYSRIYVDTRGISPHEKDEISLLKETGKAIYGSLSYQIILNADRDQRLIEDYINAFSVLSPSRYTLTKCDENPEYTRIHEGINKAGYDIAAHCFGQSVPGDISIFFKIRKIY